MPLGWTVNDLEPPFAGTITDNDIPLSLETAVGIAMNLQRPDLTVVSRPGIIGPQQNTNPGAWSCPLVVGDLPVAGKNYMLEVEVEWTPGRKQTFGPVKFPVKAEIA